MDRIFRRLGAAFPLRNNRPELGNCPVGDSAATIAVCGGFGKGGGDGLQNDSPAGQTVKANRRSYKVECSALKKGCQYLLGAIFGHFPGELPIFGAG